MAYALPASGVLARKTADQWATATVITAQSATRIGPFFALLVTVTVAGTITVVPVDQITQIGLSLPVGVWLIPLAIQGVNASGITGTILGLG